MSLDPARILQTPRAPFKGRQIVDVNILNPETAFGEVSVAELAPIIQLQFPYAVNPRLVTSLTAGTGTVAASGSLLTVATGTTTASDALATSVREAKYHPGQGTLVRWTSLFQSAGTSATEAISGIGNEEDFLGFGYDGTSFGILHRFAGKKEYRTLTFTTGAVTAGGTVTVTLDGVATETEVTNGGSIQAVAREVGATSYVGWETQVIGASVIFISHLAEAKAGSFGFVDTDTTGVLATAGVVQTITGVAPTNEWHKQTTWNEDKLDGGGRSGMKLDVSKGNVYEVQFQWLGFGNILFSVEDPATSKFVHVHTERIANSQTTPSLQNPTLPTCVAVKNKGTTTDIVVKTSSMAVFTEGNIANLGLNVAASGGRAGFDFTTETSMLALKSKPVFQSVENRVEFQPLLLTFSANGTGGAKVTTLRVVVNPVLNGDPVFTDISTATSTFAFDVAGTTVTGGVVIGVFKFGSTVESFTLDLKEISAKQPPGTLVVFTCEIDAGTSDADVAVILQEDF